MPDSRKKDIKAFKTALSPIVLMSATRASWIVRLASVPNSASVVRASDKAFWTMPITPTHQTRTPYRER
jgi:hypothetical protein